MINKPVFYDSVRRSLFNGRLTDKQVRGMEAILNEWIKRGLCDLRWLAYMLATTYHETAQTMQPIEEYGKGKGKAYGKVDPKTGKAYYGRSFVQLTWKFNYYSMGKILGIDLVNNPEQALQLNYATQILFEGMIRGTFTGRRLALYFTEKETNWINARRIINGLDKAEKIAEEAKLFYKALQL